MRITKTGAASAALILGLGMAVAGVTSAGAHTPRASLDCHDLTVSLESYDKAATVLVILDGDTLHEGTFEGRLVTSYPTTGNREHTASVSVHSTDRNRDGSSPYDYEFSATTTGCYTPPPPVHENVTPKYDYSVPVCDRNTFEVVGENLAVLYPTPGAVWTATKGDYSVTLAIGEGYTGPPTSGFGTYTITATDGDETDLFDVQTVTADITFIDPATIECEPPVVECPAGQVRDDSGECVTPPPPACPEGEVRNEAGECEPIVVPPVYVCPNLGDELLEVPAGYTVDESGDCLPPVIVCDELHAPGVLDEYGNPTSCVSNDPCPDVATSPDCDPEPPTDTPEHEGSLAITGADPFGPMLGGALLLLLGIGTLVGPRILRKL